MANRKVILRSLKESINVPSSTTVTGKIPKWLNGTLYRNGPGRYEFGSLNYKHLFDGQACIHKYAIKDGEVNYSNKLLESKAYTKTINENRLFPAFGTADSKANIIQRVRSFFNPPDHLDNCNVSVLPLGNDQLYALTETTRVLRLEPSNLKIINSTNLSDYIPDIRTSLAHPHIEKNGDWINVGICIKKGKPFYTVVKYKGTAQNNLCDHAKVIAEVPSSHEGGFGYYHSFAVTDNYVILLEGPLKISFKKMIAAVIKNLPKSSAIELNKIFPTKIHVINKQTGEVLPQNFVTDSQFTYHHMNAYEIVESENNLRLVVDISSYESNSFDIDNLSVENSSKGEISQAAYAKRIEIPINLKEKSKDEIYCTQKFLNDKFAFEFPMINYWENNGKPYRYVYGMNQNENTPYSITKMDLMNPMDIKEQVYDNGETAIIPSEPVFVPRPNAESEDDGVVLSMVMTDSDNDFLSIIDGKTMKEVAKATMPSHVKGAFTFHGFFADHQMFEGLCK